jgi:hypothetical protein
MRYLRYHIDTFKGKVIIRVHIGKITITIEVPP